jgi:hypothetical protein
MSNQAPENDDNRISETPLHAPKPYGAESDSNIDPDAPRGEAMLQYINDCLDRGSKRDEVLKQLIAYGYSEREAEGLLDDAAQWRIRYGHVSRPMETSQSTGGAWGGMGQGSGNANMWIGGIICLVGIVITVGSCLAAGEGGGSYFVAYGAIIFGGIQFFRGLFQQGSRQ